MRSPFPIWVHELTSCIVNKNSVSGKSSLSVLGKSKRRFQHGGVSPQLQGRRIRLKNTISIMTITNGGDGDRGGGNRDKIDDDGCRDGDGDRDRGRGLGYGLLAVFGWCIMWGW
ncbi:hypothetical protein LINPERPRIM_LOCUS19183 [Linum perenne]